MCWKPVGRVKGDSGEEVEGETGRAVVACWASGSRSALARTPEYPWGTVEF